MPKISHGSFPSLPKQERNALVSRMRKFVHRDILEPKFEDSIHERYYTLLDRTKTWKWVLVNGILAFLVSVFAISGAVITWYLLVVEGMDMEVLALLGTVLGVLMVMAIAIAMWCAVFEQWQLVALYQPGQLRLSHWPLALGEAITITFQREKRDQGQFRSGKLEATLVCAERVLYFQRGRHPRRGSALAVAIPLETKVLTPKTQITETWQIEVPADVPPSMELRFNQIRWCLEVRMRQHGGPNDDCVFGLTVAPKTELWGG